MPDKVLLMNLDEDENGNFSREVPPAILALSQLDFGLGTSRGAIRDMPDCYIDIERYVFRNIKEGEVNSAVTEIQRAITTFLESFATPDAPISVEIQKVLDSQVIFKFTVDDTSEDNPKIYLFGLGYVKGADGVHSKLLEITPDHI
jgi:hypothetical protein